MTIVTIASLAAVIVGQYNVAQANDEGCASMIKGAYGFAIAGLVNPSFTGPGRGKPCHDTWCMDVVVF
jgi:hypothetical protein